MMTLNIYGQYAWHTEAKIVASRDALLALKEVIDKAICYGYGEFSEASPNPLFASDGEGYKLEVWCLGGWDDKRWQEHEPEYSILKEQKNE